MPAIQNSDVRPVEFVGGAGEKIAIPIAHIDQSMRGIMDRIDKDLRAYRMGHFRGTPHIVERAESI